MPIDARAPIPTEEERHAERDAKRADKDERRALKKQIDKVEDSLGVAERILKRARKEVALRSRLMGVAAAVPGSGGSEAGVEGRQ